MGTAITSQLSLTRALTLLSFLFLPTVALANVNFTVKSGVVFPDKKVELLWNSYIPSYMDKFFSPEYAKVDLQVSAQCQEHIYSWIHELLLFKENPQRTKTWALHMIDSWGKTPEGILSGHVNSLGAFDECVELRGALSNIKSSEFQGLYCTTYIVTGSTSSLSGNGTLNKLDYSSEHAVSMGTLDEIMQGIPSSIANCFPSSCSQDEVQMLLTNYFLWSNITSDYDVIPSVGNCVTDSVPELTPGVVVMITILSMLGLVCIVATVVETWEEYRGKRTRESVSNVGIAKQSLLAFSFVKNTKALLSSAPGQDTMTCFYGLRFLSMAWIILMHTNSMFSDYVTWNMVDIQLMYKQNWSTLIIKNGLVSVDTFFTMSGLLVTYNLLKSLEKSKGRFNLGLHYLHRYLRLTPAYAFIIGCLATILPYLSSGPNWYIVNMWSVNCQRNWWHNLLYINNLIDYGNDFSKNGMCAGVSWYLSADMQLFLLAPIFVYPLWRWDRLGKLLLGVATLGSILTPGILAYVDHLTPTLISSRGDSARTTKLLYFAPWSRAGPYFVGMWTGYLLFKTTGGTTFKLPKRIIAASWLISTSTALAVVLGISSYFDPAYNIPLVGGAFYAGLHRFVWGLVVSWVIVACIKGYAGWVNEFLSWNLFGPLSRLTFCMYLASYFIQMAFHLRLRQPLYYDTYMVINLFFAHLLMSILISYICTVSMEVPFLRLDKLFLGRFSTTPRRPEDPTEPATPQQSNV
ncbi:unnamed protein product [Allacma fusca]|uniref:Nose resistant-to-fluoxetine protein N-terminal domain-containing protein n=1 Tax=Allacma fusca TaxID=39272 RepID=A0A8J2PKP9_9HEXA|nr:unnamed protein product [Allacma fusca]